MTHLPFLSQLGGKGANLCEMAKLGLNVPPGFVISTSVCREFFIENKLPSGLMDEVREGIKSIEDSMGSNFGDMTPNPFGLPLLLSVRSGAAGTVDHSISRPSTSLHLNCS